MGVKDEFHDDAIPVVGSCIAGRVWRAWADGALTGVTYGQVWSASGNRAHCPYIGLARTEVAGIPDDWRECHHWSGMFHRHGSSQTRPHRPGALGCSCGWWSYHDLSMSASWRHAANGTGVVGVVHAHGLMTRGTKGYRSEFADIAALVRPLWADITVEDEEMPSVDVWQRVTDRYPVPIYTSIDAAMAAIHGRRAA